MGDMSPRKIFDFDHLRSLLVPFWGEIARVAWLTASLVIVFETFKRSQNLQAWLRFAPRRGKNFQLAIATARIRRFSRCSVELRDTNTNCVSSDA